MYAHANRCDSELVLILVGLQNWPAAPVGSTSAHTADTPHNLFLPKTYAWFFVLAYPVPGPVIGRPSTRGRLDRTILEGNRTEIRPRSRSRDGVGHPPGTWSTRRTSGPSMHRRSVPSNRSVEASKRQRLDPGVASHLPSRGGHDESARGLRPPGGLDRAP